MERESGERERENIYREWRESGERECRERECVVRERERECV